MANRVIQAKVLRAQKRRRKAPKSFSYANSGPNKHAGFLTEVVKDDGTVARSFQPLAIAARSKIAGKLPNWSTMDRWIVDTFKYESTEALYARTSGLHTDIKVVKGDALVIARLHQSKSGAGTLQGESHYVKQILIKELNHERRIYISGDSVFFVEEVRTKTHLIHRISHEYDSAIMALQDHKNDRILWDKKEKSLLDAD